MMAQADQVGEVASFWVIALTSSFLFRRERRALEETAGAHRETIAALASSLDLREGETALHSKRVQEYALLLARHLGIKERDILEGLEMGEKIFSGKVGPWMGEARLVDMEAQLEQSGVSAKTAARFAGKRHLMLILTDPAAGEPVSTVAVKVVVTGPDKASSSIVTLIPVGSHIGVDVDIPTPGKYTFKAEIESGGKKESATFPWRLR